MKKNLGLILLTCLIFYSSSFATTHTNRTFLMPRPVSENMALRYAMWHNQIDNAKYTKRGTTFQVSPFYQHSTDKSNIGKYFGYYAPEEGSKRDYINIVNADDFEDVGDNTWASYIVHDSSGDKNQNLAGTMKFKPYQEIYGVHFDFHENLDTLSSRLFYEFSIPVVHIKNDLDFSPVGDLTPITLPNYTPGKTLQDYFKGDVLDLGVQSGAQQDALRYAKIDGSRSRTDFSDITTKLGYRIVDKKSWGLSLSGYCVIPTGNSSKGEYLFEPVCGNGGNWFLGFGPDVKFNVWEDDKKSFDLFSVLKLSYGLQNTQKRTLNVKKDNGAVIPFSQYYLVGQKGLRQLMPFANVSTQDVKVEPRWQFEMLIDLSFTLNFWHIDLGYNFFTKEKENVSLKSTWQNNTYAFADTDYDTAGNVLSFYYNRENDIIVVNPDTIDNNLLDQNFIQDTNLNFDSIRTPSQTTHKFYLALSYMTNWKNPLLAGLGGSYEFANSNSAMDNYMIWSNISLSF